MADAIVGKVGHSVLGTAALTGGALLAFAANSILCRLALGAGLIDAGSFSSVRLLSGAAVLACMLVLQSPRQPIEIDPIAALALFVYVLAFSWAYVDLSAGAGALVLFGAVQITMIGAALYKGERLSIAAWCGLAAAITGLGAYLLPENAQAPRAATWVMVAAGCAWAVYSLRGAGRVNPTAATAWNFICVAPLALFVGLVPGSERHITFDGVALASLSGAVASGMGYVMWYRAVKRIPALTAASVQLCVPLVAALGGVLMLGEEFAAQLAVTSVIVIGGIGLVIRGFRPPAPSAQLEPR